MPLSARNERFQILKKLIFAGNGIYYLYTKHCADDKSLLRKGGIFMGYISVAETAKNGMCQNEPLEITALMIRFLGLF